MSKKDDLDSEFEALMKGIGIKPKQRQKRNNNRPKDATAPVHHAPQKTRKPSRLESQNKGNSSSSSLDISLQEFTESIDKVSELKNQIDNLRNQNQNLTQQNQDLSQINKQQTEKLQHLSQQVHTLQKFQQENNIEELKLECLRKDEYFNTMQEQWKNEKSELLLTLSNVKATTNDTDPKNAIEIIQFFEKHGISTTDSKRKIVKYIAQHPEHYLNLYCTDEVAQSIRNEIILLGQHISDLHDKFSGLVIPVAQEYCEFSTGKDIKNICRQLITEFLLNGWKNNLIVGIPQKYIGVMRELFSHETIIVSINTEYPEYDTPQNFDVIIAHNMPESTIHSSRINFSEDMTSVAETLHKVLQSIENYIAD